MPLSDSKLTEKAREVEELQERINRLKAKQDKAKEVIANELDRRGTRVVEHDGIRITLVQNEYVDYDIDKLRELVSTGLFRKVTEPKVNKDALSLAVQAGKVDPETVAAASNIRLSKPFPRISRVES